MNNTNINTTTKKIPMMGGFYTMYIHEVISNQWRVLEGMTGVTMIDGLGKVRHINGRSPFDVAEAIAFAQTQSA